jgi:hypothetical protein
VGGLDLLRSHRRWPAEPHTPRGSEGLIGSLDRNSRMNSASAAKTRRRAGAGVAVLRGLGRLEPDAAGRRLPTMEIRSRRCGGDPTVEDDDRVAGSQASRHLAQLGRSVFLPRSFSSKIRPGLYEKGPRKVVRHSDFSTPIRCTSGADLSMFEVACTDVRTRLHSSGCAARELVATRRARPGCGISSFLRGLPSSVRRTP